MLGFQVLILAPPPNIVRGGAPVDKNKQCRQAGKLVASPSTFGGSASYGSMHKVNFNMFAL